MFQLGIHSKNGQLEVATDASTSAEFQHPSPPSTPTTPSVPHEITSMKLEQQQARSAAQSCGDHQKLAIEGEISVGENEMKIEQFKDAQQSNIETQSATERDDQNETCKIASNDERLLSVCEEETASNSIDQRPSRKEQEFPKTTTLSENQPVTEQSTITKTVDRRDVSANEMLNDHSAEQSAENQQEISQRLGEFGSPPALTEEIGMLEITFCNAECQTSAAPSPVPAVSEQEDAGKSNISDSVHVTTSSSSQSIATTTSSCSATRSATNSRKNSEVTTTTSTSSSSEATTSVVAAGRANSVPQMEFPVGQKARSHHLSRPMSARPQSRQQRHQHQHRHFDHHRHDVGSQTSPRPTGSAPAQSKPTASQQQPTRQRRRNPAFETSSAMLNLFGGGTEPDVKATDAAATTTTSETIGENDKNRPSAKQKGKDNHFISVQLYVHSTVIEAQIYSVFF